eukprot:gene5329-5997_t
MAVFKSSMKRGSECMKRSLTKHGVSVTQRGKRIIPRAQKSNGFTEKCRLRPAGRKSKCANKHGL